MKPKSTTKTSWLHSGVLRASRLHFIFVGILAAQNIIYDAWNLVTPNAVMNRWILTSALLGVTTAVWYLAHTTVKNTLGLKMLVWLLVLADITVASFNVYAQRGMASRAVMIYAVAIALSAVLLSRAAIFTAAAVSVAAYLAAAYTYFTLNFNEGYKIELYGEVGFYSAVMFLIGGLIWTAVKTKRHS